MKVNLAIVGSRSFIDYEKLKTWTDSIIKDNKYTLNKIVSGGAKGADTLAEKYARELGVDFQVFLPDWDLHGKRAGIIRNVEIFNNADVVIAFWDGKSTGTKHMISLCNNKQKKIYVVFDD